MLILVFLAALQGVCMLLLLHPSSWEPGKVDLEEDLSVITG